MPDTGFAIFVGCALNIKTGAEQEIAQLIIPTRPIAQALYRCDKIFHVDQLVALFGSERMHGLVIIGGEESRALIVCGTSIKKAADTNVDRMNRHRCGGQSSNRFLHIRQSQIADYVQRVVAMIHETYFDATQGKLIVQSIVLAGTGEIKDQVQALMTSSIKQAVMATLSIANLDDTHAILQRALPYFQGANVIEEAKTRNRFCNMLKQDSTSDRMVYGQAQIQEAAENGNVKELLVYESAIGHVITTEIIDMCKACGATIHTLKVINDEAQRFIEGYGGVLALLYHSANQM